MKGFNLQWEDDIFPRICAGIAAMKGRPEFVWILNDKGEHVKTPNPQTVEQFCEEHFYAYAKQNMTFFEADRDAELAKKLAMDKANSDLPDKEIKDVRIK